MTVYRKAFQCLTPRDRRRSLMLLSMMILMALLEVIGIASVMPFLAVLANPAMIEANKVLAWLYARGGFMTPDGFLIALGISAFLMLIFTALIRSVTFYTQSMFVQMQRHNLGCRLLEGYLRQPYAFFLNRHTGDMSKNILSEVDQFVDRALLPIAQMISYGLVVIALFGFLVVIDPVTALSVIGVLAGAYVIIFRIVRGRLAQAGQARLAANRQRFEAAGEALGGIKPIKILGREARYLGRFRTPSLIVARQLAKANLIGSMPRFVVEAIGMGGIILIALVLTFRYGAADNRQMGTVLPLLGLYGLAGYRMLPAVQNIYQNLSGLRFATPVVETISRELILADSAPPLPPRDGSRLPLTRDLVLDGISFTYPNTTGTGVHDITLTLPRGSSLGIIGTTGAGKTTLVDVILGLLIPRSGQILIDGVPVTDHNRRAWQDNLGYVPQEIYLTDSSIAENIALGLRGDEIDMERIAECARMARIHDFITSELPQGYATHVGERGVRLSGGQRQRIGIARALYHDPEVIVFDEATSALDTETESEVMAAIGVLSGHKTLIIIAHRLTTVEACDVVVRMKAGRIVAAS